MLPSSFVLQVEQSVDLGKTPRPGIRTKNGSFTPVLASLLAQRRGQSTAADDDGLALATLLRRVASGELVEQRQMASTLRHQNLSTGLRFGSRIFHLLY